jgi:hypothetical protein
LRVNLRRAQMVPFFPKRHAPEIAVALANKMARIAWAMMKSGRGLSATAGCRCGLVLDRCFVPLRFGVEPMPRQSIGDRPMTDAERQARDRAARAAGAPVVRTRRPADHRSRARRWHDTVAMPMGLQARACPPGWKSCGKPARQRHRRGIAGDL